MIPKIWPLNPLRYHTPIMLTCFLLGAKCVQGLIQCTSYLLRPEPPHAASWYMATKDKERGPKACLSSRGVLWVLETKPISADFLLRFLGLMRCNVFEKVSETAWCFTFVKSVHYTTVMGPGYAFLQLCLWWCSQHDLRSFAKWTCEDSILEKHMFEIVRLFLENQVLCHEFTHLSDQTCPS